MAQIPPKNLYILDTQFEYQRSDHVFWPKYHSHEWLDEFITWFEANHSYCCLVLEDIDSYAPMFSRNLKELIIGARHHNVGLILVSRRILGLPKEAVCNFNWILIFQGMAPEDRDYLASINPEYANLEFPREPYRYLTVENL